MRLFPNEAFHTARRCGVTVNGRINAEVRARSGSPVTHEIAGFLDRAVWFWPLPPGQQFDEVDLSSGPTTCLQAAGHRDRMTVELRITNDGRPRHFVLGHARGAPDARPTEVVRRQEHETYLLETELFTAAEAVPLFLAFWQVEDVPEDYARRAINL